MKIRNLISNLTLKLGVRSLTDAEKKEAENYIKNGCKLSDQGLEEQASLEFKKAEKYYSNEAICSRIVALGIEEFGRNIKID